VRTASGGFTLSAGAAQITITSGLRSEHEETLVSQCLSPSDRTATGTAVGLAALDLAEVVLGPRLAVPAPTLAMPIFTFSALPDGALDLLAARSASDAGVGAFVTNRVVIQRGIYPGNGASVGTQAALPEVNGTPVRVRIPDFDAASAWNVVWELRANVAITWFASATGWHAAGGSGPPRADGVVTRSFTRTGTATPWGCAGAALSATTVLERSSVALMATGCLVFAGCEVGRRAESPRSPSRPHFA
jgi:hypothetical protein